MVRRKVSSAELIQWLDFMLKCKAAAADGPFDETMIAFEGLGALTKDPADQARVNESRALTQAYSAELRSALKTALTKGGPIEAIGVCKRQAPLIASTLSRQTGAKIERVSRRYRNPMNAPEPWQIGVLEHFEYGEVADTSLPEYVEQDASGTRYMKAIRIQPVCLVCHGDALADDVREALDTHYPHDQARGYSLNDLRGAFSISWPATEEVASSDRNTVAMTNSTGQSTSGAKMQMESLSKREIRALSDALNDEYKARATYDQVIDDFGSIRPFVNIREAESRHIDALHRLYEKYGIEPPPDVHADTMPSFDSVKAACEAAVKAEIHNAGLYDRIMGRTERPDILRVFANLREASMDRHLPAFQQCVERNR